MFRFLDSLGIASVASLPVTGSAGELVYSNGAFYGWTGSAWKSLNNDLTTKNDVGLGNVDNVADLSKPISTATQTALDAKVAKGLLSASALTLSSPSRILGRRSGALGTATIDELSVTYPLQISGTSLGFSAIPPQTVLANISTSADLPYAIGGSALTNILTVFSPTYKGLVPAPGSTQGYFLRDDGLWIDVFGNINSSTNAANVSFDASSSPYLYQYGISNVQDAINTLDGSKLEVNDAYTYFQYQTPQLTTFVNLDTYSNPTKLIRATADGSGYEFYSLVPFSGASSGDAGIAGIVPTPNAGDQVKFLRGDGTWAVVATGSTSASTSSFSPYGNIASTTVQTAIQELDDEKAKAGLITAAGLNMTTGKFLGRASASTGAVEELTPTTATSLLNTFSVSIKGLVPAPGTASGNYLRDDGTWVNPTLPNWAPVYATGTAASQAITLPESGLATNQVLVFVNGLKYKCSEYTISGTTLTMTTNDVGDDIEILRK